MVYLLHFEEGKPFLKHHWIFIIIKIYFMKKFILFFIFIITIGISNAQQTGYFTTQVSWTNTDGPQTRSLRVYVPTNYSSLKNYALVIGFHGLGGAPATYLQNIVYYATNPYFGDVIVACPDDGTPSTSWFSGDEDFKIISAIISTMDATHSIDLSKVFAQGFSFGGKSAYLHGLDEADYLKGIIAHSPGFYSTADVYNTCTDPQHCQHKYNYANAWKVLISITAGSGEYNLGLTEPYLALAKKAVLKINASGGNAKFFEDATGYHNLPPLSIAKLCWDYVNTSTVEIKEVVKVEEFKIYPTPANTVINLESTTVQVQSCIYIYNVSGILVDKIKVTSEKTSIHVSNLSNGLYFLKLYDENKGFVFSEKFIVLH